MIYFVSDLHIGHANIIRFCNRPFNSLEEMNNALISNWNSVVEPTDTVIVIGDIFFKIGFHKSKEIMEKLNGIKWLIRGNHDGTDHHMLRLGFQYVVKEMKMRIGDETVTISHYPYPPTRWERFWMHIPYFWKKFAWEKFLERRPKNDGGFLIHGHVHEKWKFKNRMINMSVEVNDYKPISLATIASWINERRRKQ